MKKAIKRYLNKVLPESGIDTIHGKYYMRFELGGDLENGTPERVDQVVSRAIFNVGVDHYHPPAKNTTTTIRL